MDLFKYLRINIILGRLSILLAINVIHLATTKQNDIFEMKYGNNTRDLNEIVPCDSPIYCIGGVGTLLHTVQMSKLYNDSKTFVDKPLKNEPNHTLRNFEVFMKVSILPCFNPVP